ncbi:hypothetical protein Nepgr_021424 [Nepenthes gracilis]|uniref:Uncharacterized protein n=1 Tax=Nepenthes gracilis TaxID=150966 RepID=A0AAD3SY59_NEPGR|nr:hypothetical protein Nepgr_021424 [Nepenthes gracilis]
MVNCPCSPDSDHGVHVSVDLPKPPSPGGSPIPVESPQLDESPLKSPGFLQNSNSDHSLTVASVATHWGEIALPSGALTSSCNEPLIDHGLAAAEPGSHGLSCAEQVEFLSPVSAGPGMVSHVPLPNDEFGPIPGVDGSTSESIARIIRKYSLVEVVDGLLNKAPSAFQDVSSFSLSGCSVEGHEASVAEAVESCDLGRGNVHTLPIVDPSAGDPLARAKSSLSDDNGSLQCPEPHLPICFEAARVPERPSKTLTPIESGHDSVLAMPIVYPDCGAEDPTAVSRAFAAAFQLVSPALRNEDELFARQAINGWQRMARRQLAAAAGCSDRQLLDLKFGGALILVVAPGLLILTLQEGLKRP